MKKTEYILFQSKRPKKEKSCSSKKKIHS